MSSERNQYIPPEARESKPGITIGRINPDDPGDVRKYFQFEVDQGFTTISPKSTFEGMVDFRQQQMKEGKLYVATAREGDELVATSVVVLESGAMGKEINDDEAWAAGTVVRQGKRGIGIGEKMSAEQDAICREAGKKSIVTVIAKDNYPSMRLRMKVGYELEGVDKRENEVNYYYRKTLRDDVEQFVDLAKFEIDVFSPYDGVIDAQSPNEILVDPNDAERVQVALFAGYRGRYLVRPDDVDEAKRKFDKNLLLFIR